MGCLPLFTIYTNWWFGFRWPIHCRTVDLVNSWNLKWAICSYLQLLTLDTSKNPQQKSLPPNIKHPPKNHLVGDFHIIGTYWDHRMGVFNMNWGQGIILNQTQSNTPGSQACWPWAPGTVDTGPLGPWLLQNIYETSPAPAMLRAMLHDPKST